MKVIRIDKTMASNSVTIGLYNKVATGQTRNMWNRYTYKVFLPYFENQVSCFGIANMNRAEIIIEVNNPANLVRNG